MITKNGFALLALVASCGLAQADFTAGNLIVMRVDTAAGAAGSGSVFLDEVTTGGAVQGTIALPTSGSDAFSLSNTYNHDRHLHRSADGRFVTFAGYNAAGSATDSGTTSSSVVARTVGFLGANGSVDLSTKLTDAYDGFNVRGAYTTDGNQIWLAGDNNSGTGAAALTGGLRYTTRGSSTTTNLSQVQVLGGAKTPDNVRDVAVFDGQLYDCSGSSGSIGKGVLQVGIGTPTSGSQTLTGLTTALGVSASSFVLLDLNSAIAGVDTMYAATDNLRKYIKQANGTWAAAGIVTNATGNAFEQIIAKANVDGSVSVYAAGAAALVSLTDANGVSGSIQGLTTTTVLSAASGFQLGGIEFAPVPAPGAAALGLGSLAVAARRRRR